MKHKVQINDTVRDATPEETAAINEVHAQTEALAKAQAARDTVRSATVAKLAALGLTDDEIAALLP